MEENSILLLAAFHFSLDPTETFAAHFPQLFKNVSHEVNVRIPKKNVYKKQEHLFQELVDTILRYLLPLVYLDTQLNFERPSVPVK